jgi:SAM-dependent MidA family methyltransferase
VLAERIAERIRREGPIPFAGFMEAALYDARGVLRVGRRRRPLGR